MNDTITSPRQKAILNLINQSGGLSSAEIKDGIEAIYKVSKPTVIRDLNNLLDNGLLELRGSARSAKYFPRITNPLLREFDLETYFSIEPDKRLHVKEAYDSNVLENASNLFSSDEQVLLTNEGRNFAKVTATYDPTTLKRELERFIIELSWKSSKIEGNTYTLLETEALIKDSIEAVGKRKEEAIMILNHKQAFKTIMENKEDFQELSLTNIAQLHNVLVKGLNVTTGIRKHAVGITGTKYKPLDNEHQLREALEKTVKKVNRLESPLEKAFLMSFMIPYIQPFADGNKRTARMLTNAILLSYDLFPMSYRSVSEDDFKKALIVFYEQGSITNWKRLFIDQYIFSNKTYFAK